MTRVRCDGRQRALVSVERQGKRAELVEPEPIDHLSAESLGFGGVGEVHVGRLIVFRLQAQGEAEARERVDAMCRQLLANPVTEDFEVTVRAAAGSAA